MPPFELCEKKMKVLVVLGHPDPKSFNHAIASAVCETLRKSGHTVVFRDLCAEGFDPLLPKEEIPEDGLVPALIQQQCEELASADGIVIVHPNWWGQPPAILKGWVDRIFRPGVAYRFADGDSGEGVPIGLLRAKAALVLNTSNTPDEREKSVFGDPLEALWKRCIFDLCGVRTVHRRVFSVVVTSTLEERRKWLGEAKELTKRLFPGDAHNPQVDDQLL
jgi:NAD(P)H dehydrogenase (quinone)